MAGGPGISLDETKGWMNSGTGISLVELKLKEG